MNTKWNLTHRRRYDKDRVVTVYLPFAFGGQFTGLGLPVVTINIRFSRQKIIHFFYFLFVCFVVGGGVVIHEIGFFCVAVFWNLLCSQGT